MSTVHRKILNVTDLPVGTEVQMARRISRAGGTEVRDTRVTKVTKTTLSLANGYVFNVALGSRFLPKGHIGDVRKTRNSLTNRHSGWFLYLPGDPYLAAELEGDRLYKEREEARKDLQRTLDAVTYRTNHENVQAALDALNTWLANNPKEA